MTAKPELIVVGAGGHGHVVAEVGQAMGYVSISFIDQNLSADTSGVLWPMKGSSLSEAMKSSHVIVGIGNNAQRLALTEKLLADGFSLPVLVHPTACVAPSARLGAGTVVMPMSVVNARAVAGIAAIINSGSIVEHDCDLGKGVHISPGACLAGNVNVESCAHVGLGSRIKEGLRIGRDVVVAAGAVVVNDVADGLIVVGVPAKPRNNGC